MLKRFQEKETIKLDVNLADISASIVISDGEKLEGNWEQYVQPGLILIAKEYGSAGLLVRAARACVDDPDIAQQRTRYTASIFRPFKKTPDEPVLDISLNTLREGLSLLETDQSGISFIKTAHSPDFFSIQEVLNRQYSRIAIALIRYGFTRYQMMYKQLEQPILGG